LALFGKKIAAVNTKGKKETGKKALRNGGENYLPRISNPHGGATSIKLRSTYLQEDAKTKDAGYGDGTDGGSEEPNLITIPLDSQFLQKLITTADYVVPLSDADAFTETEQPSEGDKEKDYMKESFSVRIPYPTPPGRVFAVLQSSSQIVVCMPFTKGTTVNSSPFLRVPVFDMDGKKLEGSGSNGADLVPETAEKRRKVSAAAVKTTQQKKEPPQVKEQKSAKAAKPKPTPEEKLIPVGF
jgi:hypothetical protein